MVTPAKHSVEPISWWLWIAQRISVHEIAVTVREQSVAGSSRVVGALSRRLLRSGGCYSTGTRSAGAVVIRWRTCWKASRWAATARQACWPRCRCHRRGGPISLRSARSGSAGCASTVHSVQSVRRPRAGIGGGCPVSGDPPAGGTCCQPPLMGRLAPLPIHRLGQQIGQHVHRPGSWTTTKPRPQRGDTDEDTGQGQHEPREHQALPRSVGSSR